MTMTGTLPVTVAPLPTTEAPTTQLETTNPTTLPPETIPEPVPEPEQNDPLPLGLPILGVAILVTGLLALVCRPRRCKYERRRKS